MKDHIIKVVFTFIILCTLCFVSSVKAEVTEEQYEILSPIFSDLYISLMSDEKIALYTENDFTVEQKLYKVTQTANGTYNEEIDLDLEDDIRNGTLPSPMDVTFYQTTYKKISLMDTEIDDNGHYITIYTQWLINPVTKSYDVTAMRVEDANIIDGTQDGTQVYIKNGTTGFVNYSPNGTNIVKYDNGFGISMNLVDGATYFETDISAIVQATSQYAKVYGTYQHAVTDVSLDESQSYFISHNGYGRVLNFATGVQHKYDGMNGVYKTLSYS